MKIRVKRNVEVTMAGKVIKNGLRWLVICIIVFLISIFLHECGHGLANHLRGISCSTGFNRVGDIYKYPKDVDFRAAYRNASESLLDFGVPITLLLASAGTFCACRLHGWSQKISWPIAVTNSMLRLIPCIYVLFVPLFTGNIWKEDEYETGQYLAQLVGCSALTYLPAFVSVLISIVCLFFLLHKGKQKMSRWMIAGYALVTLLGYDLSLYIANWLDDFIRINW